MAAAMANKVEVDTGSRAAVAVTANKADMEEAVVVMATKAEVDMEAVGVVMINRVEADMETAVVDVEEAAMVGVAVDVTLAAVVVEVMAGDVVVAADGMAAVEVTEAIEMKMMLGMINYTTHGLNNDQYTFKLFSNGNEPQAMREGN